MSPEKKIKLQAKATLANNNWPVAVGAVLFILAVAMAGLYFMSGISLMLTSILEQLMESFDISQIFSEETSTESSADVIMIPIPLLIILIPLVMGCIRMFYLMTKYNEVPFSELFYYIGRRFFRSLGVFFGVLLRCLWQAAVCFGPSYIALSILAVNTADKDKLAISDNIWYFISYALLFGGILLFSKLCVRYFLSFFLYFEDESLSVRELCELSCTYMERLKGSVMKLILSLFPWILSCILIIPCLFAVPVVLTSLCTSAKWIIALYHQSENKDE